MGSRSYAFAAALLVVFAQAGVAAAAPSAVERETARNLMDEGKDQTKAGELERALESYRKAHDIMHVPTTGMAVAKTEYALGHLVEAREAAREVIEMPREAGEPAVFEQSRKQARQLDAQLQERIPTVRIHLRGVPAEHVTVDGVEVPLDALAEPIAMNPGSRIIEATGEGGSAAKTQVALAEKDKKEIELELLPVESASPRKVTGPSLDGEPGGERTGAATALVFGGFGLAAAGITVGAVTGVLALTKAGDVKAQCENDICDPAARSDLESSRSMAMISNIGFAAGAVGAVLGIVGLALPKASVTRVGALYVTPAGAGLRGRF